MFSTVYSILSVLAVVAVLLAVLSIVGASWKNGISPMPSSALVRRKVAAEINRLPVKGRLVEAGSGWGTLALDIARRCPGWAIVGIENSLIPLWTSRLARKLEPTSANVSFMRGDIYAYPFEQVNVVVCYLYPGAMRRLSPILSRQLMPGSHVISVCFALPDWEPERVIVCGDMYRTKVYVYTSS